MERKQTEKQTITHGTYDVAESLKYEDRCDQITLLEFVECLHTQCHKLLLLFLCSGREIFQHGEQ